MIPLSAFVEALSMRQKLRIEKNTPQSLSLSTQVASRVTIESYQLQIVSFLRRTNTKLYEISIWTTIPRTVAEK